MSMNASTLFETKSGGLNIIDNTTHISSCGNEKLETILGVSQIEIINENANSNDFL